MDPEAALQNVLEALHEAGRCKEEDDQAYWRDIAKDSLEALRTWLERGGYTPDVGAVVSSFYEDVLHG